MREAFINAEQLEAIKHHCINPVDSRETGMEKPETLVTEFPEPADVKIMTGFKDMPEQELKALYDSLGLAMTFKDFLHIQNYFHGPRFVCWIPNGQTIAVIPHFLPN